MPELHDPLERRASRYEPSSDLFDRVLDRRRRRERNRRIGTALAALVVVAAAIGVVARAFIGGPETRPADPASSGFVGDWASLDYHSHGTDTAPHQTMTIRAGKDDVLHMRAHADGTHSVCWERRPGQNPRYVYHGRTMTGTGRLEDPTTMVVRSPTVGCADGSAPDVDGASRLQEEDTYTLILDPATDRLYDNLGVVWSRGAPPEHWRDPSTEAGVDGPGTFAMLHGEVTFRAAEPWSDHIEAYLDPRLFFLIGPGDGGAPDGETASLEILVNPLPPDTPCDTLRVPPSAQELIQAIRSDPDLEATAPVSERLGGIDALRMDVVAAPGAPGFCGGDRVGVVAVPGRGSWGGVHHGDLGRLYVLDLPGGSARTLAIIITAPDAALFEQAIETAAPILESFEFHTG